MTFKEAIMGWRFFLIFIYVLNIAVLLITGGSHGTDLLLMSLLLAGIIVLTIIGEAISNQLSLLISATMNANRRKKDDQAS